MEDVDKIIIHSLRQVGCDLDEEVQSIGQFTTEVVVEAAARCLRAINPEVDAPITMPPGMSARFKIGATLAQACQELGYKGEIGYQTFLYSTENDIRKVFIFLMEMLPKETEKPPDLPSGKNYMEKQKVVQTLRCQLAKPWLPLKCRRKGISNLENGAAYVDALTLRMVPFDSVPLGLSQPVAGQLPDIGQLFPSLIELNRDDHSPYVNCEEVHPEVKTQDWNSLFAMEKPVAFSKAKSEVPESVDVSAQDAEPTEEDPKEAIKSEEQAVEVLQAEVSDLMTQIEQVQVEIKSSRTHIVELSKQANDLDNIIKKRDEQMSSDRKVLKLLPEAEANIRKLDELIGDEVKKLISLGSKWDKHRAPLVEQYRGLRLNSSQMTMSQMQTEIARSVEEKIKDLTLESKEKEQLHARLRTEYEKLSKEISRSSYTRRIFEIIGNISKQKDEINRVLDDTRNVQKDINQLSGRLDRAFVVTDELIFRDAKRDETARNAYKLLATLHSDCAKLVKLVEETGSIIREIRELEDQIESENAKSISANLERITADLMQMRQESAALSAQLKSLN